MGDDDAWVGWSGNQSSLGRNRGRKQEGKGGGLAHGNGETEKLKFRKGGERATGQEDNRWPR